MRRASTGQRITAFIRVALFLVICLGALGPRAQARAPIPEPSLPSGPVQVRTTPLVGQTWEELRSLHRERADWWARYYREHPGRNALREVLGAYHDWIEGLFDQDAVGAARRYAATLEASRPTDLYGIWLVARFMHFDQRFKEEESYLLDAIVDYPREPGLWMELGNSLTARGLAATPDPYAVAAALRAEARSRAMP